MSQFDTMESTVEKICTSLYTKPHDWHFDTVTFHLKEHPDVKYWCATDITPIRELWDGVTAHVVFSEEQGNRILKAYLSARSVVASSIQSKIKSCFE